MPAATLTEDSKTSLSGWAKPLFATKRTDRPSRGHLVAKIAEVLGEPLMAWQRYVADVALEYDPATGRPAYRTVTLTIPRQNGKTQLILSVMVARSLLWGSAQQTVFAAQTGKDVRAKWKKDLLPKIQSSELEAAVQRAYLSDGDTNLLWKNGSRINMVDNTPTAGHGMTLDLIMLDEAMAHKDDTPETAFGSTIATRPHAQIWNVSTAGDSSSTYLRNKVEAGRAAVKAGKTTGTAYFEWGVPEDEDPYDLDVVAERFPAWGVTIDEEYVRWAQGEFSDGTYRRNIGNQWTETEERIVPAEWWTAASTNGLVVGRDVIAVDTKPDGSQTAIARADSQGNVQLVAVRDGSGWVVEAFTAEEIQDKYGTIVVDGHARAAGIADDLEAAGFAVERLDSLGVRKACGRFFDGLADQKVKVRADERLTEAAKHAAWRSVADSKAWHRDAPGGELLMACSLAYASAVTDEPWEPVAGWA